MQWLIKKIIILFGLDTRSLALLRIGTALLLIGECIHRAGDVFAFNTDAGVLPRTILIEAFTNRWHISLNMMSGIWEVQIALLIVSFVFACALLIGWHTRVATFLSWLLLISFQSRNLLILQNSDTVLRLMLFWALFLPWGYSASIDGLRFFPDRKPYTVCTMATFAYMIQMLLIYACSVVFKTGPEWLTEYSAVYYALSAGAFATPLGVWLSQFSLLLPYLTRGVMLFETFMPILFFIPFRTQTVRVILLVLAIGMHSAFGLTLNLGLFSWVMIVGFLGLLPAGFWHVIESSWRRFHPDCMLYFDGQCGFCNHSARIIATFLFIPGLPVVPAQDNKTIYEYMEKQRSWVMVCNGVRYTKSKAFFMLAKHSPLFGWIAWLLDRGWVRIVGDYVYDLISSRRKQICVQQTVIPDIYPRRRVFNIISGIAVLFFLSYVIVWNISTFPNSQVTVPNSLQWIASVLRLDQKWDMFSPYPIKETGWFVMPGTLVSGQKVDVYTHGLVSYDPPLFAVRTYANYRWRKYLLNLTDVRFSQYRLYYAQYLCRQWNQGQDPERLLTNFDIVYLRQITLPDNKKGPVDIIPLWHQKCL